MTHFVHNPCNGFAMPRAYDPGAHQGVGAPGGPEIGIPAPYPNVGPLAIGGSLGAQLGGLSNIPHIGPSLEIFPGPLPPAPQPGPFAPPPVGPGPQPPGIPPNVPPPVGPGPQPTPQPFPHIDPNQPQPQFIPQTTTQLVQQPGQQVSDLTLVNQPDGNIPSIIDEQQRLQRFTDDNLVNDLQLQQDMQTNQLLTTQSDLQLQQDMQTNQLLTTQSDTCQLCQQGQQEIQAAQMELQRVCNACAISKTIASDRRLQQEVCPCAGPTQ